MADPNLFMICQKLNEEAFIDMPKGYHLRLCTKEELPIWKAFPFDDETTAKEYESFMQEYFDLVYKPHIDEFYKQCLFLCDDKNNPIGTAFIWKAYQQFTTLHWVKIKKEYENQHLGKAMLSAILKTVNKDDFPIYLHTQPESYRAIKLYSDFGFQFITNKKVGHRENHLEEGLDELKKLMKKEAFSKFKFTNAPENFICRLSKFDHDEF